MRWIGVDLTRGFALLAVIVAHTAPIAPTTPPPLGWLNLSDQIASPLFAMLIGVSMVLMSGQFRSAAGRLSGFWWRMAIRGVTLVLLGFALVVLEPPQPPVDVVLVHLGVVTVLVAGAASLPVGWVAGIAGAMAVLSPVAMTALRASPFLGQALVELFFTGPDYRVTELLFFALLGVVLARLRSDSWYWTGGVAIAGVVSISAGELSSHVLGESVEPYSGTFSQLIVAAGFSLVVFAIGDALGRGSAGRARLRAVLSPLRAAGAMTLTLYCAQVVALAIWAWMLDAPDDHWSVLLALAVGSLAFAALWARFVGRGPLEWVLRVLERLPAGVRTAR